ncbi:MAG TPA: glycoside hydrolase family 3 N-terminal domain-containing protein [Opitutaceae bacterium]|nr:glycoside hydrolase family 3 N-terminal domain-containing protein [Opitutaceae bacterium]
MTAPVYRQAGADPAARVADLLARMTIEEKIDQLHQCAAGDTNPNNLSRSADQLRPTYGSFITSDPALRDALQRRCVGESRLGIPAIFAADVIHGFRTLFPIPLGQACSWDPDLLRRCCAAAAEEAHAHGVDWTFAPMVDIALDARWGRVAETFGESPYAVAQFAVAAINGYQPRLAACLKHYVGYGESEGGRDYAATDISPQRLWEVHLPPYAAGVRAGARTVMSAFNDLNGIPTSANSHTLTEILRLQWDFRGLVVSDWNAIQQLVQQGHAATEAEAAERALNAGVDLDMSDGLYRAHLAALLEQGRVSRARLDEAVRRVLQLKFEAGIFDQPYRAEPATAEPSAANLVLAEEAAARSIVLLRNQDRILPIREAATIALIGPLADDQPALRGSWCQQGRSEDVISIAAGFRTRISGDQEILIARGCAIEGTDDTGFPEAVAVARKSDVVILCVGEAAHMSGENASRSSLRLPGQQEALIEAVLGAGTPVVLVVVSGRPVDLAAFEPRVAAIVAAWQPGTRGGAAVADVLLGRRNPSGRLAITWPRSTGQIPTYHHMRPRARTGREGAYQDAETAPLYDFGHGLSYTEFQHSPIRLSRSTVRRGESLRAEITVTNAGSREGHETILWFIRDPAASITRPLRELRHFETAAIAPGEERIFHFEIEPLRDGSFPDSTGARILEPGLIQLFAADQSAHFEVVA